MSNPKLVIDARQFVAQTMGLSPDEKGAIVAIAAALAATDIPIKYTDTAMKNITQLSNHKWAVVKDVVLKFFLMDKDGILSIRDEALIAIR